MATERYRALLTGASGGIGRAVARELAPCSSLLILTGRNADALQALANELAPCRVRVISGDLTCADTLDVLEAAVREAGGIDLLVNNAGACEFHAFGTQDAARIDEMLRTNLLAPMLLTRRMLPLLRRRAQIVNIGSVFGSIGFPGFAAYCAAKGGLRAFTESLRRELSDTQIAVRYFAPRATRTAINSAQVSEMNRQLGTHEDDPDYVARQLLRFLRGRRTQRTVGWKESLFTLLNAVLPALPDRALRSQLPIIKRHLPK